MKTVRKAFIFQLSFWWILVLGQPALIEAQQWQKVKWIADGDTLFLHDGRHIRFIGINAPEVAHDDQPAEPFGQAAKERLKEVVARNRVRLEWDQEQSDRYGRKLAHVFDEKNRLLSQIMVAEGLAHVLFQKENQRYFKVLLKSQQEAMAEEKGFWRVLKSSKNQCTYIGNSRSLRFHAESCAEARKIGRKNRITFRNSWSAFAQGYAPAKECIGGIGTLLR